MYRGKTYLGDPSAPIGVSGEYALERSQSALKIWITAGPGWVLVLPPPTSYYFYEISTKKIWIPQAGFPATELICGLDYAVFLDKVTGDVFCCNGSGWELCCNMKGPTGWTGPLGPTGATGPVAPTVNVLQQTLDGSFYPTFVDGSGNQQMKISTTLRYVNDFGRVIATEFQGNLTGNADTSNKTYVTAASASALIHYPVITTTPGSDYADMKVDTSNFSYVPLTDTLTVGTVKANGVRDSTNVAGGAYQMLTAGAAGASLAWASPSFWPLAPVTITVTPAFLGDLSSSFIIVDVSNAVLTLPPTPTAGKMLNIKTIRPSPVSSAAPANIIPIIGGALSTSILTATQGQSTILVGNGSNWVQMMRCNP